VDAAAISPTIAISHNGHGKAVVVAPDVRVRSARDCVSGFRYQVHPDVREVVEIHLDHSLRNLDAELELLDEALEIQLEGLEAQIEAEVQANLEAALHIEEAMMEVERAMQEAKVKVVVEKAGGGGS
jgi:hypothetical protein